MVSDSNDDFSTPPTSPRLLSSADPLTTSTSPSMQHPSEFIDLDTYDSNNNNVEHFADPSTFSASPSPQPPSELIDLDTYDSTNGNVEQHMDPSTSPSIVPSLQLPPELMDLGTYDSNSSHHNVEQLADRLQALERMKIEMDELYYKQQEQLFEAIEKCEVETGMTVQHRLLDGLKKWVSLTTKREANKYKRKSGDKLKKLRKLVNESRSPMKVYKSPPKKLIYTECFLNPQQQDESGSEPSNSNNSDINNGNDADLFIDELDSEQLAETIQQGLDRQPETDFDQRHIDQLRRRLASTRQSDLERALKTTENEADRHWISTLFQQGELYQTLQKAMKKAEEEQLQKHPPRASTTPMKPGHDSMPSLSRQESSTMAKRKRKNTRHKDKNDAMQYTSSPTPSTSSSTFGTSSPTLGKLSAVLGTFSSTQSTSSTTFGLSSAATLGASTSVALGISSSTLGTSSSTQSASSSTARGTTPIQKFICLVELDGGICNDSSCEAAHFRDYNVRRP